MRAKIVLIIVISLVFLSNIGCKKNEEDNSNTITGNQKVTLTIMISDGILSNPLPGVYTYNSGDTVSYSFTPKPGYRQSTTLLNGASVPSSGLFQIVSDSTLVANTDLIDIRGKWFGKFIWYEYESRSYPRDIVFFLVKFSGDILAGKSEGMFGYKDNDWGRGKFSINGDKITFKIEYWDDSWLLCNGNLINETKMEGKWYFWSPWGFFPEGTWVLDYSPNTPEMQFDENSKFKNNNPFNKDN